MPHALSTELSLVIIEPKPARHDGQAGHHAVAVGPGWFDSSWDLRHGVEVKEDWFGDERLHGWIENFLRAQGARDCTASPSARTAIA